MPISSFSFPHPVLGNRDDLTIGEPTCEIGCVIKPDVVELSINKVSTGNATIDSLIETNQAVWTIRVHCPRTYFRETWKVSSVPGPITIPVSQLEGTVRIDTFVVAEKPIPSYQPLGLHEDYSNSSFNISPIEIVAIGPDFEVNVDPDFDPLSAPITSIMRISEGAHEEGAFVVIWDDKDYLLIKLSRKDWKSYTAIRQDRLAPLLHSSLVFPVLVEAISTQVKRTEIQDIMWVQRLRQIIEERSISLTDPCQAAQLLLDSPLTRAFTATNIVLTASEQI